MNQPTAKQFRRCKTLLCLQAELSATYSPMSFMSDGQTFLIKKNKKSYN